MDIQILSSIRLDDSNQGNLIATRPMNVSCNLFTSYLQPLYEFLIFDNNLAGRLKKEPVGRGSTLDSLISTLGSWILTLDSGHLTL